MTLKEYVSLLISVQNLFRQARRTVLRRQGHPQIRESARRILDLIGTELVAILKTSEKMEKEVDWDVFT